MEIKRRYCAGKQSIGAILRRRSGMSAFSINGYVPFGRSKEAL
jgi:hypothetical protein